MRIIFTPSARRQFLEAVANIYQDNHSAAAVNFRQKTQKVLSRLQDPESGRYLPEFPDFPYREVIMKPY